LRDVIRRHRFGAAILSMPSTLTLHDERAKADNAYAGMTSIFSAG